MPVQRQHVVNMTADITVRAQRLYVHRMVLIEGIARYLHALQTFLQGWLHALQRVKSIYRSIGTLIIDKNLR